MRKRKLGSRVTLTLALAILAVAIGLRSGIFFAAIPPQFFVVVDNGGPNDVAGQKDINMMGRWDDVANNALDVFWSWDKINPSGQSFDACALFDANGNGKIDYAICANVDNAGDNTNPIPKLSVMPQVYKCNDTDAVHCVGYNTNPQPSVPSLQAGNLAGNFGGTADDLRTNTDPFPAGEDHPWDTTLRVRFNKSEIPAKLANVCTYPSASIDSAVASDCIANPGGGFLKIVKNVTAGDGTFTFDVAPVPSANNGGPCDPASVGCQSYSVTTTNLTGYTGLSLGIGQNSVTVKEHDQKPAYTFTNASCQIEGNPPTPTGSLDVNNLTMNGVTILADTITTCTFINAKQPAKLTVTKVVVNDNGGTASVGDYTLTVGDQTFASGTQATIAEGTYKVAESGPTAGYTATFSGNCDASGNITMVAGGTYTCTITNDDIAPKLTLSKIVTTDNGGAANASSFTLTATGLTSFSGAGSVTSGAGFKAGTYTLTESGPTGYSASAWSCSGGSQSGNQITLNINQTATCTITNDDIQPKLTVIKKMKNDNGGINVSSDFTMTVTGSSPSPASFSGSATGTTVLLNAGSYSVNESGPTGYAATMSSDCSGTMSVGDVKTCTITNDDAAGTLTIIKKVINDNGGGAQPGDFTMHVSASSQPSDNDFAGNADGVTISINAGAFSVSETGGPSGYTASFSGCSGTMTSGGNMTCTITNDDNVPKLTLVKKVTNNNGGTAVASQWTLSAAGPTPISGAGGATSDATFKVGSYTLSESGGPSGYTASAWSCVGGSQSGSTISLSVGESATCTITNDDIAPKLTLLKIVSTGAVNDPALPPSAFTVNANGSAGSLSGSGSGVSSGSTFSAGTYNLSESGPSGYTAGAWACTGGTQNVSSITLTIGQIATCAITNTLNNIPASVKVDKSVSPKNLDSSGGTVTFTVTVSNLGGPWDPYTITSLTDTIYGDLTNSTDAKPQDNNTCGSAVGTVIAGGASYTCTWTSTFPALPANQTLSEHDVVTVVGHDDDNAGPSSIGTASDDATVTQSLPIVITNGNCAIDQYTRIFTQDAAYHFTATNSGQFFYNMSIAGVPGEARHVTLELPWPFVTQGNQPVHVYDSVEWADNCFSNYGGGYAIDKYVYLKDYGVKMGPPDPGPYKTGYPAPSLQPSLRKTKVELDVTIPSTGFAFIRQHMDDGLKGPYIDVNGDGIYDDLPYGKDGADNATDPATGKILIPEFFTHPFSMWAFNCSPATIPGCSIDPAGPNIAISGGATLKNDNQYQKNVGVGGLVQYDGPPVAGMTVQLSLGTQIIGTAITDGSGLFSIAYKHTGKAADYTVTLVNPLANATVLSGGYGTISGMPGSTTKTVTIKSNGSVVVNFPLLH